MISVLFYPVVVQAENHQAVQVELKRLDGPLADQIKILGPSRTSPNGRLGSFSFRDGIYTLSRPDGSSIVAENIKPVFVPGGHSGMSGTFTVIDPEGNQTTMKVIRAFVADRNRVSVNGQILTEDGGIRHYVASSFTGQQNMTGMLSMRLADNDEGVSQLYAADFSGLDSRTRTPFGEAVLISELENNVIAGDVGGGMRMEPVELSIAAVVVAIVIVVVIIGCFLDWWCMAPPPEDKYQWHNGRLLPFPDTTELAA